MYDGAWISVYKTMIPRDPALYLSIVDSLVWSEELREVEGIKSPVLVSVKVNMIYQKLKGKLYGRVGSLMGTT